MVKMPTLREMLEAGVHFGHKTSRWHPKMQSYIFASKAGVHVINLEKTAENLVHAVDFLKGLASNGKTVVFVGTKKQASEIVKKAATSCGMPYVASRWIGGTLTNFEMMKTAISKYVAQKEELEGEKSSILSKKAESKLKAGVVKSEKIFGGLVSLTRKPDALILIGAHDEKNALREAIQENIPVIALVDSNADPDGVTYPIPANDDATKSIELFASIFASVIRENKALAKKIETK